LKKSCARAAAGELPTKLAVNRTTNHSFDVSVMMSSFASSNPAIDPVLLNRNSEPDGLSAISKLLYLQVAYHRERKMIDR
jgi:hypothetical protein